MAADGGPSRPGRWLPLAVLIVVVVLSAIGVIAYTRTEQGDVQAYSTTVAYADCNAAHFGSNLAPLSEPKDPHTYSIEPSLTIDTTKLYLLTLTTNRGLIKICLQPQLAPNTVNVIVTLARNHFYDGIPWHRYVAGFVIQGGDPSCIGHVPTPPATTTGTCGQGGPGFQFNDEPVLQKYELGSVAMANSGTNTNGSQFFICIGPDAAAQLQPKYNLFGKVSSGLAVAQSLRQGDTIVAANVQQQS